MTPEQKIKHAILVRDAELIEEELDTPRITKDNIDELYDENADLCDAEEEIRRGEVETGIPCDWSRHYESKSVAAKMPDGSWVGWTYWYGGGKHGEPYAVDWMELAYDLDCKEEEKLVIVQTFTKAEPKEEDQSKPALSDD